MWVDLTQQVLEQVGFKGFSWYVYTLSDIHRILVHCLFVDLCRESQRQNLDCDSVFRLRTGLPQINTAHALLFKVLSD